MRSSAPPVGPYLSGAGLFTGALKLMAEVLTASEDRWLLFAAANAARSEAHHRARAVVADRRIVQLDPVLLAVELTATGAAPKSRGGALVGNALANGAMAAPRNMPSPFGTATFGVLISQHRTRQVHGAMSKNLARLGDFVISRSAVQVRSSAPENPRTSRDFPLSSGAMARRFLPSFYSTTF